ncbi:tRNA 2-thiouridine(34) synthase MnmA, partial [bacterium]|nr:tRNA 2-thiouridine(34) synthase MnmA [bacterium]
MKIAVLLSGGVDSSVALRLLQKQGHDVTAFYLKIWLEDELSYLGSCPWEGDLQQAQAVCDQAQVPLKIISLQKEYWDYVVSYTIAEIKAGRTPNPDVFCNKLIKFGFFLEKIDKSFEKIASGHYAQVIKVGDSYQLHCAPDPIKDQTYFLSYLSQEQLSRLLFPIGHLQKEQVRELAQEFDLPNKDRKDSQGICFLGKLKFSEFIKHHLGEQPGNLVEFESKKTVGKHKGFWFYTFGQRQGIGLAGGPWYVVAKNIKKNIVYISRNYYSDDKRRDNFFVSNLHWISGTAPEKKQLLVKLRHGKKFHQCEIEFQGEKLLGVRLKERDQGIAPGQFAVFYS